MATTKAKDAFELHELAALFDIPDSDTITMIENPDLWHAGYQEAIREGKSEEEAEEQGQKWEWAEQEEIFRNYKNAVEGIADKMFGDHDLVLVEKKVRPKGAKKDVTYSIYKIAPETTWDNAAMKIIDTINGVGMFEFSNLKEFKSSGPYSSSRDAVLQHLHWMKRRPEVYGDARPNALFERAMR
jgi:hypothetical protein